MARVFVFDRDPDTMQSIAQALTSEGHDVYANMYTLKEDNTQRINTDPVAVLKYMLSLRPLPDVVIAECLEVDGEKFITTLKNMGISDNMAIIAISHVSPGSQTHGKGKRLEELYGVRFIPKPFNLNKLVLLISQLVNSTADC